MKKVLIIIGAMIVLVVGYRVLFTKDKPKDDIVPSIIDDTKPTSTTVASKKITEVYTITYIDSSTNIQTYEEIDLYNNGTYIYYKESSTKQGEYGKYIIKDGVLTLNNMYSFVNGSCIEANKEKYKFDVTGNILRNGNLSYNKQTNVNLIKGERAFQEEFTYHFSNSDICTYKVAEY